MFGSLATGATLSSFTQTVRNFTASNHLGACGHQIFEQAAAATAVAAYIGKLCHFDCD
jgi:hypothetical protein